MAEQPGGRSVWLAILCPFARRADAIRHLCLVAGFTAVIALLVGVHFALGWPGQPWVGELAVGLGILVVALRWLGVRLVDRARAWG